MEPTKATAISTNHWCLLLARGLFVVALAIGGVTGCTDNHIGRPCSIGTTADAGQVNAIVNPSALECPSRICLLPNKEKTTMTQALCTAECSSDDDCADGERKVASDQEDHRCSSGFACRRLVSGLESSPIACKTICVCKDFLATDSSGDAKQPGSNGNNRI